MNFIDELENEASHIQMKQKELFENVLVDVYLNEIKKNASRIHLSGQKHLIHGYVSVSSDNHTYLSFLDEKECYQQNKGLTIKDLNFLAWQAQGSRYEMFDTYHFTSFDKNYLIDRLHQKISMLGFTVNKIKVYENLAYSTQYRKNLFGKTRTSFEPTGEKKYVIYIHLTW